MKMISSDKQINKDYKHFMNPAKRLVLSGYSESGEKRRELTTQVLKSFERFSRVSTPMQKTVEFLRKNEKEQPDIEEVKREFKYEESQLELLSDLERMKIDQRVKFNKS